MTHLKLCVYIPVSHLDVVKTALFEAGAGSYNGYDCCCWQVKGVGQFRPLAGSNPFLGKADVVESVEEYRVEMIVEKPSVDNVIKALEALHPYEVPAFDLSTVYLSTEEINFTN